MGCCPFDNAFLLFSALIAFCSGAVRSRKSLAIATPIPRAAIERGMRAVRDAAFRFSNERDACFQNAAVCSDLQ